MLPISPIVIGWVVFHRYGVLLCYDPYKLFTEQRDYAIAAVRSGPGLRLRRRPAADRLHSQRGVGREPRHMGKKVAYFTDNGQVQIDQGAGRIQEVQVRTPIRIRNAEEAEIYANADAARVDSWKQQAAARIWGDADIYPGMNIDVLTANPRYSEHKFDGRWLVARSSTRWTASSSRRSCPYLDRRNKTPIPQEPYEPFWVTAGKPKPTLALEAEPAPNSDTPSTTTTKRWVSSWTDPTVRSVQ